MRNFVGLAIFLVIIGFLLKQPLVVGLAWLLLAALLFTWFWQWRTSRGLRISRNVSAQAFLNDNVEVELLVGNRSHLPLPWLTVRDLLPDGLPPTPNPHWLVNLHGQEQQHLRYTLECKRRGRYLIGPSEGSAGVVFESGSDPLGRTQQWFGQNRLTVYPEIVPLDRLGLPSRLPLGNLKTRQPLLYDPSRIAGIRDYYPGDDPRHIDWRNTARLNSLQIKQFEPTRQMPMAIFLDLKLADYQYWRRLACEVAIVVAASLANRANQLRQPFGLYSNGFDTNFRPIYETTEAVKTEPGPSMLPNQGDAWLGQILDKLAGLQPRAEGQPLEELIGHWTARLSWGATIALIALEPTAALAAQMLHLRKAGYSPIGIFTSSSDSLYVYRRTFSEDSYSLEALRGLGLMAFQVRHAEDLNVLADQLEVKV